MAFSTRERILQQGLALMSQSGLSGVTLGVLATQVGMSRSRLFAHFRFKEEVQIGLLGHMAQFAKARRRSAGGQGGRSALRSRLPTAGPPQRHFPV